MLFLESLFPKTVLTAGDMYDLVLIHIHDMTLC